MKEGIRLFKIFGVEVSLDFSWFIIFFLVTWSLASGYFPFKYPLFNKGIYWIMGMVSSVLLFVSVLLHELTHSIVANNNGLNIRGIKLFFFGGVAQLSKEPSSARVEFDVAIAGPICSFVLHYFFKGAAKGTSFFINGGLQNPVVAILSYLALINVFLGLINLIPAYPLDGGRVLRSFIWARTKNLKRATAIASGAGKAFALALMFMGFLMFISSNIWGLWYVFIGMFLYGAARMGYESVLVKDALRHSLIREVMTTHVITIDSELKIDKAVEDYFLRFHHNSFPVVNNNKIIGMLNLAAIKQVPKEKWTETIAKDAVHPVNDYELISSREKTSSALGRLIEHEFEHLLVMDGDRLVGIVTRRDIMKLLRYKMDLGI